MKRFGWPIAAVAAAAVLVWLAIQSPDRSGRLATHEAHGPMRALALDAVDEVQVEVGTRRWRFVRAGAIWNADPALPGAPEALAQRLAQALTLLRNATPERTFEQASAEFGLDAPTLTVQVSGGDPAPHRFRAQFGALNPIGLAHYARTQFDENTQVVLLPSYVAQSWLAAVGSP